MFSNSARKSFGNASVTDFSVYIYIQYIYIKKHLRV